MSRLAALLALTLAACASSPEPAAEPEPAASPPAPAPAPAPAPDAAAGEVRSGPSGEVREAKDPEGGLEMASVSEKAWLAAARAKLAERLKIEPGILRFDPPRQLAAYIESPPPPPEPAAEASNNAKNGNDGNNGKNGKSAKSGKSSKAGRKARVARPRPPPPRKHKVVVVDFEGRQKGRFAAVQAPGSDEPPRDLRFLADGRLLYEVVVPPPEEPGAVKKPTRPARKPPRSRARGKAPPAPDKPAAAFPSWFPPPRLFVIQPVNKRARHLRCDGVQFAFPPAQNRVAFVAGKPDAAFVSVDGAQVYPRKGRTVIASNVAWSKDASSLAFLETPAGGPARLVLLAETDNPTGDTIWPLPASLSLDGARVFWAGRGKLVVGKSVGRPLFATTFTKEKPFEP